MHDVAQQAAVRHAALDALGHQLVGVRGVLEVAVLAAQLHRAQRAHAAVALVAAALEQLHFARRLFGAGEQAADHDGAGAGHQGLGDVARVADAAVGDQRDAALERFGHHAHGGDLRHAHARDDAGGADRARAHAHLHRVGAGVEQRQRGVAGDDVAADHLQVGEGALHPGHAVNDALRMAVRGVHHHHVHAGRHQGRDARLGVAAHAHRGANEQLFVGVLGGEGVVARLLDVLDGDQAAQREAVVHHQHLLDAVLVHQLQDFVVGGAFAHGDELVLAGHDVADRIVELLLEAHVAAGHQAHQLAAVHHRHAGNVAGAGELDHLADGGVRAHGEGLADDAGLEVLHLRHVRRLLLQAHVLVDDADAAQLGHGDGQAGFGDRVHGRRHDGQVERDAARELGAQADVLGQDRGVGGNEGDVVERQRFGLDAQHGAAPGVWEAAHYSRPGPSHVPHPTGLRLFQGAGLRAGPATAPATT